jgi:hypothetical protein
MMYNVPKSIPNLQFLARAKNEAVVCNLELKRRIKAKKRKEVKQ